MGSSFVSFKGKGYWSRDAPLEVWLRFLADKVRGLPLADPWLQKLGDHWHLQATVGFIGCINAGLDDYVTEEGQRETVLSLSRAVLEDLKQEPSLLPQEKLNALQTGGEGSVFLDDVPVEFFVRQGAAFIALLQGKITTTSHSI